MRFVGMPEAVEPWTSAQHLMTQKKVAPVHATALIKDHIGRLVSDEYIDPHRDE